MTFHTTEAMIDLRVIDRIEPGVGTVDRMKEGEQVHAAEGALQRTVQQLLQIAKRAAGQPVGVGDELGLILHFVRNVNIIAPSCWRL